jgi:hypothetical protein
MYKSTTWKYQDKAAGDIVNSSLDDARSMIRGEKELPGDLKGISLITKMEEYLKKNPNLADRGEIKYEMANSPFVTEVSQAGQKLGLAGMREKDSFSQAISDLKKSKEGAVDTKKVDRVKKAIKAETKKINLSKEDLSWDKFLEKITC